MTVVTDELIAAGENGNGGWNEDQLKILGVAWPPKAGWKSACIGRSITDEQAKRFVELRGVKRSKRNSFCAGQSSFDF